MSCSGNELADGGVDLGGVILRNPVRAFKVLDSQVGHPTIRVVKQILRQPLVVFPLQPCECVKMYLNNMETKVARKKY